MDLIFELNEINKVAEKLCQSGDSKVIALHGEMGAGKTTFVHAMGEVLGVKEIVSSPTFSIINEYRAKDNQTIYHIDLYRLKNDAEIFQSGVEECLYSGNLCFVEWPERAKNIFPPETLHVYISTVDEQKRKIRW